MSNEKLAKILNEIAVLLDMKEVAFKPRAYEKAAWGVEALSENIKDLYQKGGLKALEEIPGVGKGIAERIEEFIKIGHIKDYQKLKKEIPVDIEGLRRIEGIGPKTILKLYKELGVKTVSQLDKAAKAGKLRDIAGLGERTEQNVLRGIRFVRQSHGRLLLGKALPLARIIKARLEEVDGVQRVEFAGSLRRMQETVGDLDLLIISKQPSKVMDFFVSMPEVKAVYGRGSTKSSVRLDIGMDADLRVLPPQSFGAALQYFTGDKYHNVKLREIAIKKGYLLNEYGLYKAKSIKRKAQNNSLNLKAGRLVAGKTEEEIYEALGLEWMPPEIRTNSGEIDAALRQAHGKSNGLPDLIPYRAVRGDLQVQTDWTDGEHSILEMAEAAKRIGLEYIAITDHTRSLAMTRGCDEKKLLRQMSEIDKIQKQVSGIKILKGAEVNIRKDGSLDISDEVLAKLDVVGAAVHSQFNLSQIEQTQRLIRAMENPNIDIVFHLSGRIIHRREPIKLDMEAILKAAKRTKTILEINSYPDRLDIKDEYIRRAVQMHGIYFSIDSDAHNKEHFKLLEYGIAQARRGWATQKHVINAYSWKEMLKFLK